MQYMGSKNRVSKELLPILLKGRHPGQWYVEPFVGGANMIDKVGGARIGNDNHFYLIKLLRALQDGWVPPTYISKDMYYDIKSNCATNPPELVGFVGFLCSFGGKWWGGYAKNSKGDNYADGGSRVLVKQAALFTGIEFTNVDYMKMVLPPCSIVYCDPPYANTTKYKDKFNHEEFWQWVRSISSEGHTVFVSEYTAPDAFECIREIQHKTILDKNSQYPRVERLFIPRQ